MAKKKTSKVLPQTIADLTPAPDNPNVMQTANRSRLSKSIRKFGDISGIVYNLRSGQLVCGHQRLDVIRQNSRASLKWYGKGTKSQRLYVVTSTGQRFQVRLVEWDRLTEIEARAAANSKYLAGEWDVAALLSQLQEIETDDPAGFDDLGFAALEAELAADLAPEEGRVKSLAVLPPPEMTWILVGIPTLKYGKIAAAIESIATVEDVICEMTVTDKED